MARSVMTEHRRTWAWIIGAVALMLFLGWIGGTNDLGLLLTGIVVVIGFAVYLWRKDRREIVSARRALRPKEDLPAQENPQEHPG
jgi:4-hydroxybenzoate polyprenyltransferase